MPKKQNKKKAPPKKKSPKKKGKSGPKGPSKWQGAKTIKKAREYIKNCVDEFTEVLESENEKTGRVRFVNRLKVNLPKAEGLAYHLGEHRDTLYEWAQKYKSFSDILEQVNQIQANRVIDECLAGNYNATIGKLLLGKHGYKDQADVTSGGKPIGTILDEIANESNPDDNTPAPG